jgi:adenylate kinase
MKKAIVILGMAGSGKSTVGKEVAARLGWEYVSTGQIAREKVAGKWIEKGQMAPEDELRAAFEEVIEPHDRVVIDGMPRKEEQVAYLDELFDKVYYYELQIDEATARTRLSERGRTDDTKVAIEQRIKDYSTVTSKAIAAAKQKHDVVAYDATMPAGWLAGHIAFEHRND